MATARFSIYVTTNEKWIQEFLRWRSLSLYFWKQQWRRVKRVFLVAFPPSPERQNSISISGLLSRACLCSVCSVTVFFSLSLRLLGWIPAKVYNEIARALSWVCSSCAQWCLPYNSQQLGGSSDHSVSLSPSEELVAMFENPITDISKFWNLIRRTIINDLRTANRTLVVHHLSTRIPDNSGST